MNATKRRQGMTLDQAHIDARFGPDAPAPEPTPAPVVEVVREAATGRPVTERVGITIHKTDLDQARLAFLSDLDHRVVAPQSMVQWIVQAVEAHLRRTPAQRRRAAAEHPETTGGERRVPYNASMPADMRVGLDAAVVEERRAGRSTSRSGLIREAMAIETGFARARAGGELPVVEGPLRHAR